MHAFQSVRDYPRTRSQALITSDQLNCRRAIDRRRSGADEGLASRLCSGLDIFKAENSTEAILACHPDPQNDCTVIKISGD